VLTLIAAFALGGAAVAGAVQNNNSTTAAQRHESRRAGNETALTGDTAAKVRAAALAKVPGGTVDRVETDAQGHAAYEAHMTTSDGNAVTVYINAQFEVVSTKEGGRGHGGRGGRRSDETALTGDTAAKVRAAALAKAPGGTVNRLETDGDGNAAYEAHITKADGSRIMVYVNKQFNVVKVEQGRSAAIHSGSSAVAGGAPRRTREDDRWTRRNS
jgi:uncharacterized membrane protein YkoI